MRPDDSLINTYWKLMSVNGNAVRLTQDQQREPYMVLVAEDNRVRGFAGCNRLSGRYTSDGDTLRFEQMATTRKFCAHLMPREQPFLHALSHTAQARIDGNQLFLLDESDQTLARFESRLMQ